MAAPSRSSCLALCATLLAFAPGAAKLRWPGPALGPSTSDGPEVLFTFDDGPHEKVTPIVLDALRAHGVQAIFFVVGWRLVGDGDHADERRAALARERGERQLVANHTYHHAHLCTVKRDRGEWEIDHNAEIITNLLGAAATFFRTPYGSRCPRVEQMLATRGLSHTHWDIDAHEYLDHDDARVKRYLIRQLSRLEGRSVVLMHDTQATTARVFPQVLDWLDQENARRIATGAKPIRILSYADVARERLAPGLRPLFGAFVPLLRALAPRLTHRLLMPLAGLPRTRGTATAIAAPRL